MLAKVIWRHSVPFQAFMLVLVLPLVVVASRSLGLEAAFAEVAAKPLRLQPRVLLRLLRFLHLNQFKLIINHYVMQSEVSDLILSIMIGLLSIRVPALECSTDLGLWWILLY